MNDIDANRTPEIAAANAPVRVAVVQYQQRPVTSFEEFAAQVEYFVSVAADYRSDFVVFPELFTLQLLSIAGRKQTPADSLATLTGYTGPLRGLFTDLAVRYQVNLIGGSHPGIVSAETGRSRNICHVALRDGSMHEQHKIHITPNESDCWDLDGGSEAVTIATDRGPVAVLICYDSEFPELARKLVDDGAKIIFVPFCTDSREGYLRVRYCCHARAIENQCYLALAGNVGHLANVTNFDIQYSQSAILTPCDYPFARDGVATQADPNVEQLVFADLDLRALEQARERGTVRNLADRRHDLYRVDWAAR